MPKLPLTVLSVTLKGGQTWAVSVAFADGSTGIYLIPETMATVEAVRISALAMGQLLDLGIGDPTNPHRVTRRYDPRL